MATGARPEGIDLGNWDLGGARSAWAYLHPGELLGATEIAPSGPVAPLVVEELAAVGRLPVGPDTTLEAYVAEAPVSGIVVLRRGRIVFERYPRMAPEERHLLMSVSKVFASVLIGLLEERGLLDLAAPVEAILPEAAGSGWEGVAVRDVLDMASGIDCPEQEAGALDDPGHPFYRFEASLGWRPPEHAPAEGTYAYVAALGSRRPPGRTFEYTSVNTFVLSWLVERVTGRPYAEVLGEEIWRRVGFEAPAGLCRSSAGAPASHGGLFARLRDVARFGLLLTPSADLVAASAVVRPEHVARVQAGVRPELERRLDQARLEAMRQAFDGEVPLPSRQWDLVFRDGDLFKGGFGGQGLYVSPARDVVVAFVGTPLADGSSNRLGLFCRRVALALA